MEIKQVTENINLNIYIAAAQEIGIAYEVIDPKRLVRFFKDDKEWEIYQAATPLNNVIATKKAESKILANQILGDAGLPVPETRYFGNYEDAFDYFTSIKESYDVVVKPNNGMGGEGVTVKPKTNEDFKSAYENAASKFTGKVLVEQFYIGDHFRILVLGDSIIDAVQRIPAYVVGDGKSSMSELIENKNKSRKEMGISEIEIDNELKRFIKVNSYKLDSIPEAGEVVQVRENCNMSSGGETSRKDLLISDTNKDICVSAAKAMGIVLAGVDLIAPSLSESIESRGIINEINCSPSIDVHYYCDNKKSIDVAIQIQTYIYKNR
jgi:cyanophycin synthetase